MVTKKEYTKYVFIFSLLILAYLVFLMIKPFLSAIFTACILTYLFYPIYNWFLKITKNRQHFSSILTVLVIVIVVIIPIVLSIGTMAQKMSHDVKYVGDFIGQELETGDLALKVKDLTGFSIHPQGFIDLVASKMFSFGNEFLASIPQRAISFFVMMFLIYYLFVVGPIFVQKLYAVVPFKSNVKSEILKDFKDVTYAVIFGNIVTALAQGVVGYIGYTIFGVKGALFFAILTSLFSLFPIFGTTIIWVPLVISLILEGSLGPGIGLFFYGVFGISLVDNFIKPKVIGERANIHPALVLLGVVGGLQLFGFIGLFIGPMIFALLITFVKVYHLQNNYDIFKDALKKDNVTKKAKNPTNNKNIYPNLITKIKKLTKKVIKKDGNSKQVSNKK